MGDRHFKWERELDQKVDSEESTDKITKRVTDWYWRGQVEITAQGKDVWANLWFKMYSETAVWLGWRWLLQEKSKSNMAE